MAETTYGDISPRTAAYVVKELLEMGFPLLVFEKFGQAKPIPMNSTQSIQFRRYFLQTTFTDFGGKFNEAEYWVQSHFDPGTHALTEGVTPTATELRSEDTTATLTQYGDLVTITDVIMDTHEDMILQEAIRLLGEQAAMLIETVRFNVLKAGTNAFFAVDAAHAGTVNHANVSAPISLNLQRQVTRSLKRNLAKPITQVVKSTPAYGTQAIAPSYVAVCHTDLESDIRDMTGFQPAENYGTTTAFEGEIGKVEDVRYIMSTVITPWADEGAADVGLTTPGSLLTGATDNVDVYPILYFGRDAYGIVPLKGMAAITPMVVNPKPSDSDPLAQRGHVSWKAWQTAVILNQAWMARVEVGASTL